MRPLDYVTGLGMRLARRAQIERWLNVPAEPIVRDVRTKPPSNSRVWLFAILMLLAMSLGADAVARAFLPVLLRDHPVLLMSLDAKAHILLLAGTKVPVAVFILVAVARRLAVHAAYFFLGRWYGDVILLWLSKRSALVATVINKVEAIFKRFSSLAVLLLSDDLVSVLAGTVGMSAARFLIFQLLGTTLRVVAVREVIQLAHPQLTSVVTFIDGEATYLTLVFAIATVILVAHSVRRHKSGIGSAVAFLRSYEDEHRVTALDDSSDNHNNESDN